MACAHGPTAKERQAADIHYQLGGEALRSGNREEAMREFLESLRLDPSYAPSHLGRGFVYQAAGRLDEAERAYRKALQCNPNLAEAHNALGQLLAQTHRPELALAEFDYAIEDISNSEAYIARCQKGQVLYQMGRHEEGISQLKICITLAPRYCRGHRELGRIELEEGRMKEAIDSFRRYSELCAQVPDAWFQLGSVELKVGDSERARDAFERCAAMTGDPVVEECRAKVEALR